MIDPLAEVVTLLKPSAQSSKNVTGAGPWSVRRSEAGQPFYCVIIGGSCRLEIDGLVPVILEEMDFVLIPSAHGFTMSSIELPTAGGPDSERVFLLDGETRHGTEDGAPSVRMLVGYCSLGSPDAGMLIKLLPGLVHIRGERRLSALVQMVVEESRTQRPAREMILTRLIEILFIEALRSTPDAAMAPGLLRGLGDARVAVAIRQMHERPTESWTVARLAKASALSRSTFFERFSKAVGVAPMEYLLSWRMAIAKDKLRRKDGAIAEVALQVGYSSASTFNVAFTRHVGVPPGRYVRELASAGPRPAVMA